MRNWIKWISLIIVFIIIIYFMVEVIHLIKLRNGKKKAIAVSRDVSERKTVEQELMKLSQLKSELLRRTSHELKTPLISINYILFPTFSTKILSKISITRSILSGDTCEYLSMVLAILECHTNFYISSILAFSFSNALTKQCLKSWKYVARTFSIAVEIISNLRE